MTADLAAGFCGEPSVEAFLRKVEQGIYPGPKREPGSLPKWHRRKLEHTIARRHGLRFEIPNLVEDASELI